MTTVCYVYMLLCANDTYYTGYTTDISRRYQEHCTGSSKSKFTRSFPPKAIVFCCALEGGKSEAMRFEIAIKRLSRQEKNALIQDPFTQSQQLLAKLEINTQCQILDPNTISASKKSED